MRLERKALIVSVLALAMLGLAVVPGLAAPEKQFTIAAPTSIAPGTHDITVAVRNTTPNGNSNISSLILRSSGPAGWEINSLVSPGSGSVSPDNTTISINGFSPIKPGKVTNFILNITAPDLGCGSGSVSWFQANTTLKPEAFTGNSFGGDAFNFKTGVLAAPGLPATNTTSTIGGGGCSLVFEPPLTNGIINQDLPITVEVHSGGSLVDYDGNVTLAVTGPATSTVTGTGTTQATNGVASFTIQGDKPGDYTATATATGLTGTQGTFELFNAGITCQGQSPLSQGGGTTSQLFRTDAGPNSGCIDVPYTLSSDEDLVILLKDQAIVDQQGAEFKLVITWGLTAGDYPNFGETTFDLDGNFSSGGDQFVPDNCAVVGGTPQVPVNPDGNGNHWPAGSAEKPWCHAGTSIVPFGTGYQVTETFLGAGDPNIVRNK